MKLKQQSKRNLVQIPEKFESASVVIVDYRGLTVEEVTNLQQLRDAGVEMKVIKTQSFLVQLKSWFGRLRRSLYRSNCCRIQQRRCSSTS